MLRPFDRPFDLEVAPILASTVSHNQAIARRVFICAGSVVTRPRNCFLWHMQRRQTDYGAGQGGHRRISLQRRGRARATGRNGSGWRGDLPHPRATARPTEPHSAACVCVAVVQPPEHGPSQAFYNVDLNVHVTCLEDIITPMLNNDKDNGRRRAAHAGGCDRLAMLWACGAGSQRRASRPLFRRSGTPRWPAALSLTSRRRCAGAARSPPGCTQGCHCGGARWHVIVLLRNCLYGAFEAWPGQSDGRTPFSPHYPYSGCYATCRLHACAKAPTHGLAWTEKLTLIRFH